MEKVRNIEDICEADPFVTEVVGIMYCVIAMDKFLECPYHSSPERDHNNLYFCNHPLYNFKNEIEN